MLFFVCCAWYAWFDMLDYVRVVCCLLFMVVCYLFCCICLFCLLVMVYLVDCVLFVV